MPLTTALRVLAAITERKHPKPEDVELLRSQALPEEAHLDPDELAAAVIQRQLKQRKAQGLA